MSDWMNENWSLEYLPPDIERQLADALDVVTSLGLGYPMFAAMLEINNRRIYSARNIELFRVRNQPGSATLALLLDYGQRGGTIQGVQRALESIGHVACQIIPSYFINQSIQNAQARSRMNYNMPPNSGFQNTELVPCNCPTCQGQSQSSNISRRSNSVKREQNILSGSVYTGSPRTSKREKRNSQTSRSSIRESSVISSRPVEESYVGENRDQAFLPKENCPCEECRLRSDPDQTRRFTLESEPKTACFVKKGPMGGISETNLTQEPVDNMERLESGLSQLYFDSYESEESSVGNSDETYVKSVFNESQRSDRNDQRILSDNLPANNGNKLCSRSDNGQHRLGEMPTVCSVCKHYNGATSGLRARYNSVTDRNGQQDTALRKSWHGTSKSRTEEELLKSWSDSSLTVLDHSGRKERELNDNNAVGETIYSRISSGTRLSGLRSVDSSVSGNGSVQDVYQNNLESDVVNNSLADTRNIDPSDSSNFTDIQTPLADMCAMPINSQSVFNPLIRIREAQSDDAQQSRQSTRNGHQGPKVFVTYGWNGNVDSVLFIEEVIAMCVRLRDEDIRTKIDMDDQAYDSLRLNKLDWIDRNVREAKYIIVCITPTYAADIREPDQKNQASPRASQLNARYIYDKLREEYYHNSSQNRRIIPVMFSNHQASIQHVPGCMRSTLIYEYPNDIEKICEAILGRGRFRPS